MHWNRTIGMMAAAMLALGGAHAAHGQAQVDVLIFQSGGTQHGVSASVALGYTWVRATRGPFFLEQMRIPNKWELVILELPEDRVTQKEEVAQLLEEHVASGGRLLVNYNNLDEWPRLQRLLGLKSVTSFDLPRNVLQTEPPHVIWDSTGGGLVPGFDPWDDSGDFLEPDFGSQTLGVFETNEIAIVSANDARTIVNGFDWDTMGGAKLARQEIAFIVSCKADFDQSTGREVLDIFDFLAFQDLFVQQDPRANMAFDANFDLFDFLAFQDAFVRGCG